MPALIAPAPRSSARSAAATAFPRIEPDIAAAFGPAALRLVTAQLLSWRQGAGAFGGIHLHGCWGVSSALERRYHGTSANIGASVLRGAIRLADRKHGAEWAVIAREVAAQLLWQQAPEGGFFHASYENEPTYVSSWSCPIHQSLPVLALCDYLAWTGADPLLAARIRAVLPGHFEWFDRFWWQRGNDWKKPLAHAGWCGVANQDLAAIAACARYGQVTGDWSWFERRGRPALDVCLGADYHDPATGQFERGDRPHFLERTSYLALIVTLLDRIDRATDSTRLRPVIERVVAALFDAVRIDENGFGLMASGIRPGARQGWEWVGLNLGSYPDFIHVLERHNPRPEDHQRHRKLAALRRTLAAWSFADGGIPTSLGADHGLAVMLGSGPLVYRWLALIDANPAGVDIAALPPPPSCKRRSGDLEFWNTPNSWRLLKGGRELYRGFKYIPHGVLGPKESLPHEPTIAAPALEEILHIPA